MQYAGIIVGIYTFIMIGVLHFAVVKIERVIGSHIWPWFVVLSLGFGVASVMVSGVLASALLGVSGFLFAWSGPELKKQKERVEGTH
ncbi:DUF4491 family protein [Candidatus Bathyarchaeota archaeon]|jgi:hypothetical protein|nr:DUF4491 family protein [Candidatus Bathyarchaeota archaeon]MBT4319206.1 DUF4491 family protein [Candidatus Bathyarchaeota archaeon]MBT5642954.1 DUF4491 family protein [Candidatus Bathyarchaeota archaeon]MBT6605772.1 DUF4491 family protein [Candidatus Bathyarchaeota archaeon]MBT7187053.1 DUF4491 family protein [Candidatus Bathyarchaeota archaeon]